jgi:hypothetical protein
MSKQKPNMAKIILWDKIYWNATRNISYTESYHITVSNTQLAFLFPIYKCYNPLVFSYTTKNTRPACNQLGTTELLDN